ncbi:MAG: hypothetical protein FWH11_02320 [Micrococcales bacterium]|nr:hypothetical protein [Micrococcales bacterium]
MGTGEPFTVSYEAELDGDWIAVPPGFPYGRWPDARSWASDVAARAFGAGGAERGRFEEAALALTAGLPPHVDQVVWYAPLDGGPTGVAFMTVADHDPQVAGAEEWAVLGITDSLTPAQVTRYPSETFGQVVQSATTFRPTSGPDDQDQPVAGRIRTVAVGQTAVFYLETVSTDLALLTRMQPGLVAVVDAVRELVIEDES